MSQPTLEQLKVLIQREKARQQVWRMLAEQHRLEREQAFLKHEAAKQQVAYLTNLAICWYGPDCLENDQASEDDIPF